jgi:hypothetical protein
MCKAIAKRRPFLVMPSSKGKTMSTSCGGRITMYNVAASTNNKKFLHSI